MTWKNKQVASVTSTSVAFSGTSGNVKARGDNQDENFVLSLGIGNDQFTDYSIPIKQLDDILAVLSSMSDAFENATAQQPTPKGNTP